jgi:4-amino-4-deoxy-L-arabinose transferase-like glycosyltransferase
VSPRIDKGPPTRVKLLVLLAITLVAAFFRLYRLDTLPPGDGYDPAYYGVDALRILDGEWPIFLPTNFGREALFSYVVALSVALFGVSPFSIHLASAMVGILTVPVVYLLAEELLGEEGGALGQFGGLLAALVVAISYWHLTWSRYGVRAILLPLLAAMTICVLWRALRTNSKRCFAGAGFFLGLGMYTYPAARILPLLVVLGFVYVLVSRRSLARRDLLHLAIVGLVALVVFAPLGVYFVTHPGSFSQRLGQASVLSPSLDLKGNLQALGDGLLRTLLVLNFRGDDMPLYSLPGRPALNAFLSVLFLAGLCVSLLRIKRPVYAFLLTWLVVMSVPAMVSQYAPAAKRAIGALPAAMVLVAIGALVPWDVLNRQRLRRQPGWARGAMVAMAAMVAAGLLYSAVRTYRDYFVVWAGDPDLFTHFEVGITSIGKYAGSLPPDEQVYLSPVAADHPGVVFNSQRRPRIQGYDGRVCIVVPQETAGSTTYLIVPNDDTNSLDLLRAYFPQGEVAAEGPLHYQQPYFLAYRVPGSTRALIGPSHPVEVDWGNKIRLLGYDLGAAVYGPGDTMTLTLYYQALEGMDSDYTVFTHLLGPENPTTGGTAWGQSDSEPCRRSYPTSSWTTGEIVRDQFAIGIADDAPPGDYQIEAGLYLLATMTRLPATNSEGHRLLDDAALLGTVEVRETSHE